MKNVFTSREIAHVWAQQKQSTGRCPASMSFDGQRFYSYSTTIARCTDWKTHEGKQIVLVDNRHYSPSTSRHQGYVQDALRGKGVCVLHVADVIAHPADLMVDLQQKAWLALQPIVGGKVVADWKVRSAVQGALAHLDTAGILLSAAIAKKDQKKYKQLAVRRNRLFELAVTWPSDGEDGRRAISTPAGKEWTACLKVLVDEWKSIDNKLSWQQTIRGELGSGDVYGVSNLLRQLKRVGQPKLFYTMGKAALAKALKNRDALLAELDEGLKGSLSEYGANHMEQVIDALGAQEQYKQRLDDAKYRWATRYVVSMETHAAEKRWHVMNRDYDEVLGKCAQWPDLVERLNACAVALDKSGEDNAEAWRAGKDVSVYGYRHTLLRVVGEVIETSRGARVPLDVAPMLWKLVQRVRSGKRDGAGMAMSVGHYTLDKIEPDGSLHIGCHRLGYEELARLAEQLGLSSANLTSDSTELTV